MRPDTDAYVDRSLDIVIKSRTEVTEIRAKS
jgi:hypothetical protein